MYTRILVPLDGSEVAESALPYLKWFIKVSNVNEIIFMRVVEHFHVPGGIEGAIIPEERDIIEHDAVKLATEYLEKMAEQFKSDTLKVRTKVLVGKPATVVAEYVAKSNTDLIIMATHGFSGIHRLVSGSVADEILHAALVPVFIVKPQDKPPDK
jgi:nucleotide-binding universal stress UspA family protein